MKLFYHHVGQEGAGQDFPKTVWSKVPLSTVERNISPAIKNRNEILSDLESIFPLNRFNCWGVPEGATNVINNLTAGDAVLLVETTSGIGSIPALCMVEAFWSVSLPGLSEALWGDSRYPYIFFFNTIKLDLTWSTFLDHVEYSQNWQPRGRFYSVRDSRTVEFGGPSGYVRYLIREHGEDEIGWGAPDALEDLEQQRDSYLTLPKTEREAIVKSRIGQGVFRSRLIDYWRSCSVTGCRYVEILRASHIKPWRSCSNEERLDTFNGLLLVPSLDTPFDLGLVSFADDGRILISSQLPEQAQDVLAVRRSLRLAHVDARHVAYLTYHRDRVFRE